MNIRNLFTFSFYLMLVVGACNSNISSSPDKSGKPQVVATTTILGDVVSQVGGDAIELTVLLPVGSDPHTFEPTPQDVARVSDADVIFVNGLGLEVFLEPLLESAGALDKMTSVSDGVPLLTFDDDLNHDEGDHNTGDPHVWTDPNNVVIWVENILQTLISLDSDNASYYEGNAAQYKIQLEDLDGWVKEQVSLVPEANREMVTDHLVFGYFARGYGFRQVGALIPGFSTLAEPSARELAQMEDRIRDLEIKAIFVGNTVNPNLVEQVAQDTGTQLVYLYSGSLSAPGGEADSYLGYIRYNVSALVNALR